MGRYENESTGKEPFKKDLGLKKQLMVQRLKVKEFNEIKEVLKRQSEYTFKYKKEWPISMPMARG